MHLKDDTIWLIADTDIYIVNAHKCLLVLEL